MPESLPPVVYINVGPGEALPTDFSMAGVRYFQARTGIWFVEWYDNGWLQRYRADVRFVRGLAPFAIPSTLRLRPVPIWPKPSGGRAFSFHVDTMRWLRVLAYIDEDGSLEIPLLDDAGKPWFGMGVPPMCIPRRGNPSNTDHIAAPEAAGVRWQDIGMGLRPGGPFDSNTRTFTTIQQFQWTIKAVQDPVPHWVVRIQSGFTGGGANRTYMLDLFGEGGGDHTGNTTREEGSAGTVGHWKADLMWSQQPFKFVPSRNILNERRFCQGSIDVPNDPEPGLTTTTLYLTSGANQGLATGTAEFNTLPAVAVFGHATIGSYASTTENTWQPESWGMGARGMSAGAIAGSGAEKAYFSEVYLDAVSGHYAVDIFNVGANVGGGAADAALDRTFFAFALGRFV